MLESALVLVSATFWFATFFHGAGQCHMGHWVLESATDLQVLESATFEFGAWKCYLYWCWRVPCRVLGF